MLTSREASIDYLRDARRPLPHPKEIAHDRSDAS